MKFDKTMAFYVFIRLGYMLFIFHKNHKKYLNNELSRYNLNLIQALCMLMIYKNDVLNQKDLSEGLYLTKGAITKVIAKLEEDYWISRERYANDKRNYVLKLTEKGVNFIPILYELNKKWETEMGLYELNPEFMETLNELTLKSVDLNLKKE